MQQAIYYWMKEPSSFIKLSLLVIYSIFIWVNNIMPSKFFVVNKFNSNVKRRRL
jgi:hypothetical protein